MGRREPRTINNIETLTLGINHTLQNCPPSRYNFTLSVKEKIGWVTSTYQAMPIRFSYQRRENAKGIQTIEANITGQEIPETNIHLRLVLNQNYTVKEAMIAHEKPLIPQNCYKTEVQHQKVH
ncbi:MAG: hypothetical protein ACMXYD_04565 [Candidatus Woesearchaeota archaeon]